MELLKYFSESNGEEKNKHKKIAILARSKLNSIEEIIPKLLIDFDSSHEKFILVINEEQNWFRFLESIRAKSDQLSDIEWDRLIEHGKRIWQKEIKTKIQD